LNEQSQQQPTQKASFSVKGWLLGKAGQYLDGILINALFGLIFGGAFWLAQHLWGLRLIPFNVLDTILLSLGMVVVVLVLIGLIAIFLFNNYLKKHPGAAMGIWLGILAGALAASYFTEENLKKWLIPAKMQEHVLTGQSAPPEPLEARQKTPTSTAE
jgi:hypothetical protein